MDFDPLAMSVPSAVYLPEGPTTVFVCPKGCVWIAGVKSTSTLGHGSQLRGFPPIRMVSSRRSFMQDSLLLLSEIGEVFSGLTPGPPIPGLPPIRSILGNQDSIFCLDYDHQVWCCSPNSKPSVLATNIQQMAATFYSLVLLDRVGRLYGLGRNENGELGLGHQLSCPDLVAIDFPHPIKQLVCGTRSTIILAADDTVWATGENYKLRVLGKDGSFRHTVSEFTPADLPKSRFLFCLRNTVWSIDLNGRLWKAAASAGASQQKTPAIGVEAMIGDADNVLMRCSHGDVLVKGKNSVGQLWCGDASEKKTWVLNRAMPSEMFRIIPLAEKKCYHYPIMELSLAETRLLYHVDSTLAAHGVLLEESNHRVAPSTGSTWKQLSGQLAALMEAKRSTVGLEDAEMHREKVGQISSLQQLVRQLQEQLEEARKNLRLLEEEGSSAKNHLAREAWHTDVGALLRHCQKYADVEEQMNGQLSDMLVEKGVDQLSCEDLRLVWWKADLLSHVDLFQQRKITGHVARCLTEANWMSMGLSRHEACRAQYHLSLLTHPNYVDVAEDPNDDECLVCGHQSMKDTIHLLRERRVAIAESVLREGGWTTPYLIYASIGTEELPLESLTQYAHSVDQLRVLRQSHEEHIRRFHSY